MGWVKGVHQGVCFTLLLISFLPLIWHSGEQCCPVPADQDWAGRQWWGSLGDKGNVSVCISECKSQQFLKDSTKSGGWRRAGDKGEYRPQNEGCPYSPGRSTRNPTKGLKVHNGLRKFEKNGTAITDEQCVQDLEGNMPYRLQFSQDSCFQEFLLETKWGLC